MINLSNIQQQVDMNERKKYLERHDHKIWQSTDGKWNTYIKADGKQNNRQLVKRSSKKEVEDVIIKYLKSLEDNPTVKEVFTEWNNHKLELGKIKPSTHSRNEDIFHRFFKEFGNKRIKSIPEIEWEDFLCRCINDYKLNAKGFANLRSVVKGFLKRAKKLRLIDMNVEAFFQELDVSDSDFKKKPIDEDKEVFFDDEIEAIMNYILTHQDIKNIGIALMFVTGLRIGELVSLKHEDIEGSTIKIRRTESRHHPDGSKGHIYTIDDSPKTMAGFRTVVVPESAKWILDKFNSICTDNEFCMCNRKNERVNSTMLRRRFYYICEKLGIPPKSPHKIRKTYGSILLDNGLDNKLIEGQMGHTNISVTENYYHRNRRRLQQKQDIINNIPEFHNQYFAYTTVYHSQNEKTL